MATPPPAEPALAPPPGNPRFPLFDSLRAIAALSIFFTHAFAINGGRVGTWYGKYTDHLDSGVAIFFVISGFLLYRPYVAAWLNNKPSPRLGDYARRRILRIVPGYWFALTACWVLFGLPQMNTGHWWSYYSLTQVYNPFWALGGIVPAWSLAVEVSFYILLPLLAWFFVRSVAVADRQAKIQAQVVLLTAVFLSATAWRDLSPTGTLSHALPGFIDWFVVGMLLAVASVAYAGRKVQPAAIRFVEDHPMACWVAAFVVFLIVCQVGKVGPGVFDQLTTAESLLRHFLYGVIGGLIVLPAVFGDNRSGLPRQLMRSRTLGWLGLISYGIFLWQVPLIDEVWQGAGRPTHHQHTFQIVALSAILTLICAAASYYLVERPLLRFKDVRLLRRRPLAAQAKA
jgi:peptidoglycan/LPS O-acetylase OafA/YrhL